MLRLILTAVLGLLGTGCAWFQTPAEDITTVRRAVAQMDEALSRSDGLHEKSLRQLRDELRVRWLEAIDQAALDELHQRADGGLTLQEVREVDLERSRLRDAALKSVEAAYEAGRDPAIRKDLRRVYEVLRAWVLARLSAEEVKNELLEEGEKVLRGAGVVE